MKKNPKKPFLPLEEVKAIDEFALSLTAQTQLPCPPDHADILGKRFRISKMNGSTVDKEDADGMMDLASQLIWYSEHPALGYNQDTTLHEILHAIDESMQLKLGEHRVHQLASSLLALIKHNPELIQWLLIKDAH